MKKFTRRLCAAMCAVLIMASLCGCGLRVNLGKLFNNSADDEEVETPPDPVGALSWATGSGVTVVEDPDALSREVQKLYEAAEGEGIGVEYKNEAFSLDGETFACYIGNSSDSSYPLFITVYGDDQYQEELFVSGLLKPGQAFNQITFSRALEHGPHTLPVCYTQVFEPHTEGNDTDDFAIRGQTVITLNFNVLNSVDELSQWMNGQETAP